MIIQINSTTALQVNLFQKEQCLEEMSCDMCHKQNLDAQQNSAKELIECLGEHYTGLFLMNLIDEANKKLEEHDKQFKTKFARIIKEQETNRNTV